MIKLSPMRTLAYAMPDARLKDLCNEMIRAGYVVKRERGVREAFIDDHPVMFAIRHPAGVWMVRACPEVISVESQE